MNKYRFPAIAVLCSVLVGAGCQKTNEVSSNQQTPAPAPTAAPTSAASGLMQPGTEKAPAVFKAKISTTKGDFVIEVHRDWAPNGADRFYNMVKAGFLDDVAFFRVVAGFMAQFGIHGNPAVMARWRDARIPDDSSTGHSNSPGMVTFATAGPNTRTTQLFINYGNNANLDGMGFTPFGQVLDNGMEVVENLYKGYGDGPPSGSGPNQGRLQMEGNTFLKSDFPKLDYIKTARLVE